MRVRLADLLWMPLLFAACGDDAGDAGGITVRYLLSRGVETVACSAVSEAREAQVTLFAADGLSVRPGYPKKVDCNGEFSDPSVPPGSYVVEVAALGQLDDDPDVQLYRARTEITAPGTVDLSLQPQVGTLTISWSFESMGNLAPCDSEIGVLYLFVSTEAAGQGGAYQNLSLRCDQTPFVIPRLFSPQTYSIRLEAYGADTDRRLYSAFEMRVIERGNNPEYHVILRPIGGRLLFDFRFNVGGAAVQTCDDDRVGAQNVTAVVRSPLGDDPVIETIDCAASRPVTLSGVRFVQGLNLDFELFAIGRHRFKASRAITMTPGDNDLGLITLDAVGTATVGFTVTASSACAGRADLYDVTVSDVVSGNLVRSASLDANGRSYVVSDVPYGEYMVTIAGKNGPAELCRTSGRRSIQTTSNDWMAFEL